MIETVESMQCANASHLVASPHSRSMIPINRLLRFLFLLSIMGGVLAGCGGQSGSQKRGDKTRETVAWATERMRPEIQWTATKVGVAAKWVADEALAAAEGFFEGWTKPPDQLIDLNSATNRQLESLPGIMPEEVHRIVRSRPYHDKPALVADGIISEADYRRIKDRVTVN